MKVGDNEEQFVYAQQTVVIPDGDFHQVHNTSSEEDLVFICTFNDQRNH
jgi:mannose-6-phosphate isomerase-like protein (cupin superfamily)